MLDSLQPYAEDMNYLNLEEIVPVMEGKYLLSSFDNEYLHETTVTSHDKLKHLIHNVLLKLSEEKVEVFMSCLCSSYSPAHKELYTKIQASR